MANRKRSSWSGAEAHFQISEQEAGSSSNFERPNSANGWRNRRLSDVIEGKVPETSNIKRWDGAARACSVWDNLRRDPELWYRNGNCVVHLYKRGQSHRGPSFNVPFDGLLEAKCHPLLIRFIARDVFGPSTTHVRYDDLDNLNRTNPNARIELYIPPPAMANKETSMRYYIAMRNFFAWVFRRSMVGEHLGMALIWLLNTMSQLRCPGEDNMDDLISYMDEEGYLDMRNQPIHALAILHFAEYFQCKTLYIDAFTHSAGMSDRLFAVPEYQILTSVTRKLIRQVKSEMDMKLAHAGVMLRNFLEDDLSEANIGLTAGGRAHLERFRSFLLSYFANRLGYYPPGSVDSRNIIFETDVYRVMRADFDALYDFLVDKSFTTSDRVPPLAQGGICTLQTVHGFDLRNKFMPLRHPLPLLPDIVPSNSSRRIAWLNKTDKLKPDQRLVAHSALMKATNKTHTVKNPLVAAYRKFEEDSVFWPLKSDRNEKLSQVDARKIRWILVYSAYQVVRSCTETPPECQDTEGVDYHIALSTASLPPWREARRPTSIIRKPDDRQNWGLSMSVPTMPISAWPSPPPSSPTTHELKPDVDYFALTHKKATPSIMSATSTSSNINSRPTIPPRVHSLNSNFRRSLQMFNSFTSDSTSSSLRTPRNRSSYHEIVIQGYGNGTNNVFVDSGAKMANSPPPITTELLTVTPEENECEDAELKPELLGLPSPSASSISSALSATNSTISNTSDFSTVSTTSTARSSLTYYSAASTYAGENVQDTPSPRIPPQRASTRASVNTIASSVYSLTLDDINTPPPAVPRKNSRRKVGGLHPCPLRINKSSPTTQLIMDHSDGWRDIDILPLPEAQRDVKGGLRESTGVGDEVPTEIGGSKVGGSDVWAQFSDVGGLTEVSSSGRA